MDKLAKQGANMPDNLTKNSNLPLSAIKDWRSQESHVYMQPILCVDYFRGMGTSCDQEVTLENCKLLKPETIHLATTKLRKIYADEASIVGYEVNGNVHDIYIVYEHSAGTGRRTTKVIDMHDLRDVDPRDKEKARAAMAAAAASVSRRPSSKNSSPTQSITTKVLRISITLEPTFVSNLDVYTHAGTQYKKIAPNNQSSRNSLHRTFSPWDLDEMLVFGASYSGTTLIPIASMSGPQRSAYYKCVSVANFNHADALAFANGVTHYVVKTSHAGIYNLVGYYHKPSKNIVYLVDPKSSFCEFLDAGDKLVDKPSGIKGLVRLMPNFKLALPATAPPAPPQQSDSSSDDDDDYSEGDFM